MTDRIRQIVQTQNKEEQSDQGLGLIRRYHTKVVPLNLNFRMFTVKLVTLKVFLKAFPLIYMYLPLFVRVRPEVSSHSRACPTFSLYPHKLSCSEYGPQP